MAKLTSGASTFLMGAIFGPPLILIGLKVLIWGVVAWGGLLDGLAR